MVGNREELSSSASAEGFMGNFEKILLGKTPDMKEVFNWDALNKRFNALLGKELRGTVVDFPKHKRGFFWR